MTEQCITTFLLDTKSEASDANMGSLIRPITVWEALQHIFEYHAFVPQRALHNPSLNGSTEHKPMLVISWICTIQSL